MTPVSASRPRSAVPPAGVAEGKEHRLHRSHSLLLLPPLIRFHTGQIFSGIFWPRNCFQRYLVDDQAGVVAYFPGRSSRRLASFVLGRVEHLRLPRRAQARVLAPVPAPGRVQVGTEARVRAQVRVRVRKVQMRYPQPGGDCTKVRNCTQRQKRGSTYTAPRRRCRIRSSRARLRVSNNTRR